MVRIIVFISIAFLSLFARIHAQNVEEKFLQVAGTSELDMQPLPRATATLYEGNTIVKSIQTGADGSFSFKLEINKQYTIHIEKEGLVSKSISFNTQMPDNEKGTWMNEFSIGLIRPCGNIDYSVLKQPVDRVSFDAKRREFVSDKEYVNSMRPKIEAMMMKTEQCQLQSYEDLVKKADVAAKQNNLTEAKKLYEEAIKIYPTESYPSKRITEINNTLAKQNANSEVYKGLIAEADALAAQGRLAEAIQKYEKAVSLNPSEAYPKQKAVELRTNLEKEQALKNTQQQKEDRYNQAMAKASVAYTRKDYAQARQYYQEASEIKPEESLPKSRVQEIQQIEAKKAAEEAARVEEAAKKAAFEKEYLGIVAQADQLFREKKFDEAKAQYAKALTMKPAESYPAQRVKTIENAVATEQAAKAKAADDAYKEAITAANNALAKNQFELAKQSYQKALSIKPDDLAAKKGITETGRLEAEFARNKSIEEQYAQTIASGDAFVAQKKWDDARKMYTQALTHKPGDKYSQTRIVFIDNSVAAEQAAIAKANENSYNEAIAAANIALAKNQFEVAKQSYQKALTIKPDDLQAKKGIAETDRLAAEFVQNKNRDEQYNKLITSADEFIAQKKWTDARQLFAQALTLKPGDKYATSKIVFIDNSVSSEQAARAKAIEEQYKSAVASALSAMSQKQYDRAREDFKKALSTKPNDEYATGKLAEIDRVVLEEKKKTELEQTIARKYQEAINAADNYYAARDYSNAKAGYNQALQVKPGDGYAIEKLSEVDRQIIAEESGRQKKIETAYADAMNQGNALLTAADYPAAIEWYRKALVIKPADNSARSKISLAELLMKQDQERKLAELARKTKYNELITSADKNLAEKNYSSAASLYQQAVDLMPGETYPRQKLNEVNQEMENLRKLAAEEKARDNAYSQALVNADKYFKARDYNQAKDEYTRALTLKPGEAFPKTRIAEIGNLIAAREKEIAEAKARADGYTASMNAANSAFASKDFTNAKDSYLKALKFMPGDVLASEQIKKIDYLVAEAEKIRKHEEAKKLALEALIKSADNLFDQARYTDAKTEYKKALALEPANAYAKQKITRIDEINRLLWQSTAKTAKPVADNTPKVAAAIPMGELNFRNESERQLYLNELVKKYPAGITLEKYIDKYKETYRYIVIRNNEAQEFRHIKYTTYNGAQFSVNGKPITQMYFETQTRVRDGESFKEIVLQ